jgi:hypothetical protein
MSGLTPGPGEAELRIYRFAPGTRFEGAIVGALERIEGADAVSVLDVLFVARDPESGELAAIDLETGFRDGTFAALLDFRLNLAMRRAVTRRTVADHRGGVPRAVIESVGDALEPGGAILAILVAGPFPGELEDAMARTGGRRLAAERTREATLAGLAPRLRSVP